MQHRTGKDNAGDVASGRPSVSHSIMRETTTLPTARDSSHRRLLRLPLVGRGARVGDPAARALAIAARGIELVVLAFGWLVLPVWPFVAAAITRDASYLRRYPGSLIAVVRHIAATWRAHAIERVVMRRFGPSNPTRAASISGECTHCGNCCLYRSCIFLSLDTEGRSSCRIYGGSVWEALPCGDYPLDGQDIALYRCPSFAAVPSPALADAKVIPIFPVAAPGLATLPARKRSRAAGA